MDWTWEDGKIYVLYAWWDLGSRGLKKSLVRVTERDFYAGQMDFPGGDSCKEANLPIEEM